MKPFTSVLVEHGAKEPDGDGELCSAVVEVPGDSAIRAVGEEAVGDGGWVACGVEKESSTSTAGEGGVDNSGNSFFFLAVSCNVTV